MIRTTRATLPCSSRSVAHMNKPAYVQGDIAIIRGVVELSVHGGAPVIIMMPDSIETRAQVASAPFVRTENDPLKSSAGF